MLIVYGTRTLCDDTRGDFVETDHDPEREVDIQALPDSIAPSIIPRDNHRTTLTFRVTRTHASMSAAAEYIMDEVDMPLQATLRCSWGLGSGVGLTRYLPGAVITRFPASQRGAATYHAYTFVGGRMTKTAPRSSTA